MKILQNEKADLLRGGWKLFGSEDFYNPGDCWWHWNSGADWSCMCSGIHTYYFFGIQTSNDSVNWVVDEDNCS